MSEDAAAAGDGVVDKTAAGHDGGGEVERGESFVGTPLTRREAAAHLRQQALDQPGARWDLAAVAVPAQRGG